jgi:hypothetical protein
MLLLVLIVLLVGCVFLVEVPPRRFTLLVKHLLVCSSGIRVVNSSVTE